MPMSIVKCRQGAGAKALRPCENMKMAPRGYSVSADEPSPNIPDSIFIFRQGSGA